MKQAGENLFDMLPSVWQTAGLLLLSFFVSVCVIAGHAPEKVADKGTRHYEMEFIDGQGIHLPNIGKPAE